MAIAFSVDARDRRRVLPLGDQDRADAARLAELLERVGRGDEPVGLADDDDGRGQRAAGPRLRGAVADDARQRDLDLRERHVAAVGSRPSGILTAWRGAHSVLQRRPSAAIIASASRGPHSPAS